MTTGTIPTAFQVRPLSPPSARVPLVHGGAGPLQGLLTGSGLQSFNQTVAFITSMNRIFPCSASGTDIVVLTVVPGGPQLGAFNTTGAVASGYYDYDVFSAVAANTSVGPVTAYVVTPRRPNAAPFSLPTLKVFKTNGSAQAGAGDLVQGLHYTFTFVDVLDTGAGGFVLR